MCDEQFAVLLVEVTFNSNLPKRKLSMNRKNAKWTRELKQPLSEHHNNNLLVHLLCLHR